MTIQEFIVGLQEELEIENNLENTTNIKDLDEWDSMTAMLLIGYVSNEFNVTLTAKDLEALSTIDTLIERIGADKFN
ncbi:phosphopantetheine-binding protein [Flavobacterium sp.]|uniref:phosphopantetheine-binding protein n=1 Tax=Flavobacterium sp. TaxID=239 RepID=UPI00286D874D|nr:phosphopantetheine-binding protein [Flavobacterium sp.]